MNDTSQNPPPSDETEAESMNFFTFRLQKKMDVPLLIFLEGRRQNVCVKDSVIDCPPVLAFPDIHLPHLAP